MVKIEDQVEEILHKHPAAKDDDRELFLAWIYHIEKLSDYERDVFKTLVPILRRMPSLESITRARRKLQEQYPYLRGNNYKIRKQRADKMRQHYSPYKS